jgi:hypothetical protein
MQLSILTLQIQTKNASFDKAHRFHSAKPWNYESYETNKLSSYVPSADLEGL